MTTDTIRLLDLQFFTLVGDLPHERTTPQPLEIDVEVRVDLAGAGRSDRLADGLDYRELYERVAEAVSADPRNPPRLLETVAERVAERLLALDAVEGVRVRCRKPRVVLPGPSGKVEIEIERP
ncbi:MAG TPA: dihydroneopterin aldolase [Gemmatimonadota bacterium]|nr:dihydroneopterin aldolase [Gemmatimonadota bacterium]